MNTVLLVENFPADTAFQFCIDASFQQKKIDCLFFYNEGVCNLTQPRWAPLNIPLFACTNSLEARKINVNETYLAGLATFVAHALQAGHVVQFNHLGERTTQPQGDKKNFLILIESQENLQAAIDMTLAVSAFEEIMLSVLFKGAGILALVKQDTITPQQKQIQAWPWYDIHHVYIASPTDKTLILPATPLLEKDIAALLAQQGCLLQY